jgi:hypothetical protein
MPQPNWYNDNVNRAFPLEYKTAGVVVPDTGSVSMLQLPDDFIADCGFTIGPAADFKEGVDSVYLYEIRRIGDDVYFDFRTTEANMASYPLVFIRSITAEDYSLEYLDSDHPSEKGSQASISDSVGTACRQPFWSGYLVTGDMSSVDSRLADGDSITNYSGTYAIVEPALIDNMSKSIVNSFELANADRTRSTSPVGCTDPTWPFVTGLVYESARCVQGDVKLKSGYNVKITVTPSSNTITLGAVLNAGEGQPCDEVKLFPTETPPIGSTNGLLEGGLLCNEVLRAINGVGGPDFKIIGGQGVSVIPDPENNCIVIDVNLLNLDLCEYSYTSEAL